MTSFDLNEVFEILNSDTDEVIDNSEHGKIVGFKMLGYQDINIYEDGHEEVVYTYID